MIRKKVLGWTGVGVFASALWGCGAEPIQQDEAAETWGETSEALTPMADDCTPEEMTEILREPVDAADGSLSVTCNFTYPSDPQNYMPSGEEYPGYISRVLRFETTGVKFDCRNAHITPKFYGKHGRAISVDSVSHDGVWSPPHHILIQGCYVEGNVLIGGYNKSRNCDGDPRCSSDIEQMLIDRRQATAPHHISLFNLTVTVKTVAPPNDANGVHFSNGVTFSSLTGSDVHGSLGRNTAIYLSPESAHNSIVSNSIHVVTENREQIAIDGSANNYIADNDFSGLNHGGVYIFRNCGESGDPRIQKPWNNAIVNNRFYYDKFDGDSYPAVWVASRTSWMTVTHGPGYLYNSGPGDYCNEDRSFPYGSGRDDFDNAKDTIVADNQIRKGEHNLSPASMIWFPDAHDTGSLPYTSYGNVAVSDFTHPLTYSAQAVGEPSVRNSLYMVQGPYLLRTDDETGVYVTLNKADWSRTTSMAAVGEKLYIIQDGVLYCANTGKVPLCGTFRGTWDGPTTMTAVGTKLYITQANSLWSVDTVNGNIKRVGTAGNYADVKSMTRIDGTLYYNKGDYLYGASVTLLEAGYPSEVRIGGQWWGGPTSMTALAGKLYIAQADALWAVTDLTKGTPKRLTAYEWSGVTSMTAMNGALFVTQASQLWTVNPNSGTYTLLPSPRGDWAGPISMAAMP